MFIKNIVYYIMYICTFVLCLTCIKLHILGTAMVLDLVSCFKILSSLSLLQELKQQRQKKMMIWERILRFPNLLKNSKKPSHKKVQKRVWVSLRLWSSLFIWFYLAWCHNIWIISVVILSVKEEADINGPKSFKKVKYSNMETGKYMGMCSLCHYSLIYL